jgi:DNA-binding response OmpR family regulator
MIDQDAKIVVVDDEPEILHVICEVLDDDGFQTVCMERPDPSIAERAEVSVYLLDLMLPGMSGIELAGQLKARGAEGHMIAMSASADMLRAARNSGLFDDVLSKPFDLVQLLDRVEAYAS